jgi:hypothetical protein
MAPIKKIDRNWNSAMFDKYIGEKYTPEIHKEILKDHPVFWIHVSGGIITKVTI